MGAVKQEGLLLHRCRLHFASNENTITKIDSTGSNLDTVQAEFEALTYKRVASILDTTITTTDNSVDTEADDTGIIDTSGDKVFTISGTFFEVLNSDFLVDCIGLLKKQITGSATPITGEALGTGWTIGQPIKLVNKNGDNTEVASIVIDADAVALVAWTDYNSYVGDGTNGELGYTYIVPITAQAWVLDADYSYTPNTTTILWANTAGETVPTIALKVEEIDSADVPTGNICYFSNVKYNGDLSLTMVDKVRNGSLPASPFSFAQKKGGVTCIPLVRSAD